MEYVRGRRYNREKKAVGAPEGNKNRSNQCGNDYRIERTAEKHAQEYGVSEKTVRSAGKLAEAVDE